MLCVKKVQNIRLRYKKLHLHWAQNWGYRPWTYLKYKA